MAFLSSQPTKEDVRIEENRGQMGVILLRKKGEFRGLGSGSIVNLNGSKLFRNYEEIKWCLLTSDSNIRVKDIHEENYFYEYWSSDLKTIKKHSLRKVAQSNVFHNPTPGLALIPVCPSWPVSELFKLKSSVLDKRRAFPTGYCYGADESDSSENIECFIVGSHESKKESLTVERFTLITERDNEGRLQHCLRDDVDACKTIFRSYDDIIAKRSHLFPRGAVILKDDGPKATCIGILNFTEEGSISPVFFTPETFTGKVQLYYPTSTDVEEEASSVAIRCSEDKIEPNTSQTDSVEGSQEVLCSTTAPSQAPCPIVTGYENQSQMFSSAEAEHQDGASLTNDDQTVYPDDYTLQTWQKLCEEVAVENTKLKLQQSELRNDIKRTEQENDVLRAENDHLRKENDDLRSKTEELCTKYKKLREDRDAERIMSREDHQELLTENEQLKTNNKELREHKRKLRAENIELRKDWNAESKESREVIEELRAQNSELKTENKELRAEKEEFSARLEELADQLKELLNQPDSAVCGDDTSSIKLHEEVADENTKLKQQYEENDVLRAENEDLRKEKENMHSKTEQLRTRCKQLQEDREADREDYQVLLTENEQLKTINKELREHNRKLRREGNAESEELREDNRKLRAENSELLKNWNVETKELHEVIEELRAQNSELETEINELRREKEELSARYKDQLKELLNQPDSAVSGDDTSSIKDSNNVKAEEPSGSSANSPQGDSDGSRKEEEPFLDPLSQDVSKLD